MGWAGFAKAVMAIGAASSARDSHMARKDQKNAIKKQEAAAAQSEANAAAAAEKKRREILTRQSMMSTIHTSPFGVNTPAATTKKTLLGQ